MKNHPYYIRLWLRQRLPWFLINLGIGEKGIDCFSVGAAHKWYNIDGNKSGCYYCKQISEEINWNEIRNENNLI
ncbi:hypothetical protein [Tenacibaculum holothuriorum]|uniref:hypothetical protein n=1 Tax=Tenacibaculum holothuriorum TaxID=1635173 RepID=UPI001E39AD40|nr:hypothetical protein [Tenacibaculum holothuriorum]